jgi:DNA replication protein DnaC
MDHFDLEDYMTILKRSGVPKSYRLWTTSATASPVDPRIEMTVDEHNCKLAAAASKWLSWTFPPEWILVSGKVGRGKTTWVTGVFNDYCASRIRRYREGGPGENSLPIWMTEADLFMNADRSAAGGYSGRAVYIDRVTRSPLLVLDDLGGSRRKPTESQVSMIRYIVQNRHAHNRPTLMTSNIESWDQMERVYGDHIVSRLIESTEGMVILEGPDRRLEKVK